MPNNIEKSEMLERVVYSDGWSVQLDMEIDTEGVEHLVIYVFPDQKDSYPWSLEVSSRHEAYNEMYWFMEHCRAHTD